MIIFLFHRSLVTLVLPSKEYEQDDVCFLTLMFLIHVFISHECKFVQVLCCVISGSRVAR